LSLSSLERSEVESLALAERTLGLVRSLWRGRSALVLAEAAHLEFLLRAEGHRKYGFGSFSDFAREMLQMSGRSVKRRVALRRIMMASSAAAAALEDGRLSPCQALALRPVLGSEAVGRWIDLASTCTVRELRRLVAAAGGGGEVEDEDDALWQRVTFAAPVPAAIAWDQGVECARRVLGSSEAPVYSCVEAMLAEATPDLLGGEGNVGGPQRGTVGNGHALQDDDGAAGRGSAERALNAVEISPQAREALAESIRLVEAELAMLSVASETTLSDIRASVRWLREGRGRERGVRLLFIRLLRDAERAGVLEAFGYPNVTRFLIETLKISERSVQRMLSEAWLFEGNARLAQAFEAGKIGLGQAHLIHRVARGSTLEAFIDRAQSVTHLEFEREARFLERLAELVPKVGAAFRGPLPLPGLEAALRAQLLERGWTDAAILDAVMTRLPKLAQKAMQEASQESKWGHWHLRRLELLVEIVALGENDPPTLAPVEGANDAPDLSEGREPSMLASNVPPTLAPRFTTISFWGPQDLIRCWQSAIRSMQERAGPLPTWAAAMLILQHAVNEWERVDPSRRPAETPIYERDEYRCQAPGCSARRGLEAHHIIFRSRRGSDDPENLITLCHAHHRQGIHENRLKVSGQAPWNLKWRMGSPGYRWEWPRPGNQSVILSGPS
jgi:HNH endonuclease